jgi:hypothetical protein
MYNNSFFKKILIMACVVFLYSCDKDYNSIGDGLIGDNHFDFVKYTSSVVAYNQKIGPIQSNNLPINALGIFDNPAFGTTTANFATQLVLESGNPTIGKNPEIESVVLTIPYFSTLKSTDSNGDATYQLDSIYGPSDAKIMLSVFESGYFMRDLDPEGGFQQAQKYYTNQNSDFNGVKVGSRLNNSSNASQNDSFVFSAAQYKSTTTTDGKDVITRVAPGMRLDLNASYFKTKIIEASALGKLSGNDVFKEYFRGLYFKVERSGSSPSAMALLDFKKGKITIKYKVDTSDSDATRVEKTIVLNFTGNTVSLLDQSNTKTSYASATTPANINRTLGDEKLYLKGGEGSLSIIELFGPDADNNGIADELETIRKNGWLINEANLVFHVDGAAMTNGFVAKRIYLYDFENNRSIFDYVTDPSVGSNSKNGKTSFGGILTKDNAGNEIYKLRITNQIRVLIQNKDSTNIRLGVVVTEDINTTASNKLRTASAVLSQAPRASVMNPLGTIIYGGKSTVPEDKRLKLEIYYTKPN